jgi:hypothetical protein
MGRLLAAQQEVPAQAAEEREIFINIHSGLKTFPVRKVIEYVIEEAEQNGIVEIDGSTKHVGGGVWDINIKFLKGKNPKVLKWRYGREKWDLQPLDETTRFYSFPLDNYVIGPAINMSLDTIEGKGVSAEKILGRGVRLPSGLWKFSLDVVDPQGTTYVQEWLYDWKHKELTPQHFDHSDLDKVLAVCVAEDGVDYSILKKDANLEEFLKKASKMDKLELAALSREEQIAFWIDVYNATVLKRVAEKFPIKSVKEIKGFFDKEKLKAAGKAFTLDELKNYLLENFKEKRVLFALVPGTKSSPPLRREAYCGRLLEWQLDDDLKCFLNDPANLYVTKAGILLSPVLEPLEKEGTLRDFLISGSSSLPQDATKALMDKKKEIKFIEYDWALNSAE